MRMTEDTPRFGLIRVLRAYQGSRTWSHSALQLLHGVGNGVGGSGHRDGQQDAHRGGCSLPAPSGHHPQQESGCKTYMEQGKAWLLLPILGSCSTVPVFSPLKPGIASLHSLFSQKKPFLNPSLCSQCFRSWVQAHRVAQDLQGLRRLWGGPFSGGRKRFTLSHQTARRQTCKRGAWLTLCSSSPGNQKVTLGQLTLHTTHSHLPPQSGPFWLGRSSFITAKVSLCLLVASSSNALLAPGGPKRATSLQPAPKLEGGGRHHPSSALRSVQLAASATRAHCCSTTGSAVPRAGTPSTEPQREDLGSPSPQRRGPGAGLSAAGGLRVMPQLPSSPPDAPLNSRQPCSIRSILQPQLHPC